MNYRDHRAKWNNCTACSLCERRRHVVLYRGDLPCDVLFIGEAPGTSEDDLGQPFVGPAGQLLDLIIARALMTKKVRLGFTNLVACLPLDSENKKISEPPEESIEACSLRLDEIWSLSNPKGIIFVGKLPQQHLADVVDGRKIPNGGIIHPAAILRAEKQNQGLMVQNNVVSITDLIEEINLA